MGGDLFPARSNQSGGPAVYEFAFRSHPMAHMTKKDPTPQTQLPAHGADVLPSVTVDSYNVEIEDEDGFIGDRASKGAFWELLEKWRKPLDDDPLGKKAGEDIGKKKLVEELTSGDPQAAALVLSAIEEFAQQMAYVIRRFMRLKDWRDTEAITVGGGFSGSRLGELAVARCGLLLRAEDYNVDIGIIAHDPDEAGLIGAAHLLPAWMLKGHDGILAVDVGGTNIRAGIVNLNLGKASDLSKAHVLKSELWRHGDEDVGRDDAIERLVEMLSDLNSWAGREKIDLAPVIGIGCPGIIHDDGSIARGGQNLPGNWESARFNLPKAVMQGLPQINGQESMVVVHNDAVVQGLSQLPLMQNREHWAVLTIGTGLGNARYTNRSTKASKKTRAA
jgi:predicted NBD/HSP70 family sugar kinase